MVGISGPGSLGLRSGKNKEMEFYFEPPRYEQAQAELQMQQAERGIGNRMQIVQRDCEGVLKHWNGVWENGMIQVRGRYAVTGTKVTR